MIMMKNDEVLCLFYFIFSFNLKLHSIKYYFIFNILAIIDRFCMFYQIRNINND